MVEPDRYRIIEQIGSGGMGVVYRAEDRVLGRTVALKVLGPHVRMSAAARERFQRELQVISRLDHPNVVRMYHAEGSAATPRCAMEYIPGTTLAQMLKAVHQLGSRGPGRCRRLIEPLKSAGHEAAAAVLQSVEHLSWPQAVCRWMAEVAEGLHHAHQAHLIHRDVKPSNVLLGRDGHARIADFGVATITEVAGDWSVVGTVGYVAPEVGRSGRGDARSDIFAVGASLAEALQAAPLEANPDLTAVMEKARAPEPADRYSSAADLARDLERVLLGDEVHARPPTWLRRTLRSARQNPATVLAVALILSTLGVALWKTLLALGEQFAAEQALLGESETLQQMIGERDGLIGRRSFLVEEMDRLQAVTEIVRLHQQVDDLWPMLPSTLPRLRQWQEQARPLTDPTVHHEFLARLRLQTLQDQQRTGVVSQQAAQPDWQQADRVSRWFHQKVQSVVADIRQLQEDVTAIDRRIQRAKQLERSTLTEMEEQWEDALTEIFLTEVYQELDLSPLEGLVPLGVDPHSGLFEFWDPSTGDRPIWEEEFERHGVAPKSGLVLVLIPGGTYTVGAAPVGLGKRRGEPHVDPFASSGSIPVHEVTLAPFLISKYEMTQAQWQRLAGYNPSQFREGKAAWYESGDNYPVDNVRQRDAIRQLRKVGLKLPTEAQWETAARAGTTTPFISGETPQSLEGYGNFLDRSGLANPGVVVGTHDDWLDDGYPANAPVGRFLANDFGLFDTAGNVAELCRGTFVRYSSPVINEWGEREGGDPTRHIFRGQSHFAATQYGGVARREARGEDESSSNIGLRPSRDLVEWR